MKKKKGFTLLEVMVALSIFSILSLMIIAMSIQSQKILSIADHGSIIQNEVRTALLKIQSEAKKYDEVVVNNKFGVFNGDKWEIVEGDTSVRELLRFSNDEEDIAKVYIEVNEGDKHQLVEFNIDKSTNAIIDNSKNVLISSINGDDANSILVRLYESDNDNKLITIDCSSILTEDGINKTSYIASFSKNVGNYIDLPSDGSDETGGGNVTDEEEEEEKEDILDGVAYWDSNTVYYGGETVYYNGVIYKSAWYSHGSNPEIGDAWIIISEEPTEWKSTKVYLTDQKVIYNGKIYKAKWYAHAGLKPGENDCWELVN